MMIFMAGPIIRCQADIERTEFDLDNDEKEKQTGPYPYLL